jgi:hypothetical protein
MVPTCGGGEAWLPLLSELRCAAALCLAWPGALVTESAYRVSHECEKPGNLEGLRPDDPAVVAAPRAGLRQARLGTPRARSPEQCGCVYHRASPISAARLYAL